MTEQRRPGRYPAEMRERAVRMVFEAEQHTGARWEAICIDVGNHRRGPSSSRKLVSDPRRRRGVARGAVAHDSQRRAGKSVVSTSLSTKQLSAHRQSRGQSRGEHIRPRQAIRTAPNCLLFD